MICGTTTSVKFSILSVIIIYEVAFVGAQLSQVQPVQVQPSQVTQSPLQLQQIQPQLQVAMGQPKSQTIQPIGIVTQPTTKPIALNPINRVEIKPVTRIITPMKSFNATTMKPKSRMKIVKALTKSDDSSNKGFFSSLVNVDRTQNKTTTGVHIPLILIVPVFRVSMDGKLMDFVCCHHNNNLESRLIFDMTNDKDMSSGKSKLDLTVLSGLVTVNRDRERGKGPLTVTVFGMPVYTGTGNSGLRDLTNRISSTLTGQRRKLDDTIDNVAGSRQLTDASARMYSDVKRAGERGLTQVTDQLDRVSSFLKEQATPISNINGRPASRELVTKSPQFKLEELKPRISLPSFKNFVSSNSTAHDYHLQNF